jgi:glycosyltransferase involved in cell wall biosynthesis
MTQQPPIVFYSGGFAPVGGVESFTRDLVLALRDREVPIQLACWGGNRSLLDEMEAAGVSVYRSAWRWGCRWGWPDRLLLRRWRSGVERAAAIVYCKTFDRETHREIQRLNPTAHATFITPYRPRELWAAEAPEVVREILGCFQSIIVQAKSFEGDLRAFGYQGAVSVLPYVPPAAARLLSFPALETLTIGYLGRLAKQKNLEYLLEAFAILHASRKREGLSTRLMLFGDGPEQKVLRTAAARLGIEPHVAFEGELPRSQVPEAIDRCHMFAVSSVSEGQCLAALEILSRGRPLVATPVGALPEIIDGEDAGALAPLDDPGTYAAAMARVGGSIEFGSLTPERVARAYSRRFPRGAVIEAYAKLIPGSSQRGSGAAEACI